MMNDREELEKTVTTVMDEQIARVSEITRCQDRVITATSDRLLEISTEIKKMSDGTRHRSFENHGGSSSSDRLVKVFCLKFNGTQPEGWIFLAGEYFEYHGITEESKVRITGLHMKGATLDWIRRLKKNNMLSSWEKLLDELRERFGESEYEDSLAVLTRLQQTSTVAVYIVLFEKILNEISGQTKKSLTFFVAGLREDLRSDLKIMRPSSLKQAFSLAKMYEANRVGKGSLAVTTPFNRTSYRPNMTNVLAPLLKTPNMPALPSNKPNLGFHKQPLNEERKARAAKGLCYYCDEKFVPGHRCRARYFRLDVEANCLVEMGEDEQIQPGVEMLADHDSQVPSTEISLHAISGVFSPQILRL